MQSRRLSLGLRAGAIAVAVVLLVVMKGANTIWYVQVAALITGHFAGLLLAHDRAITVSGAPDRTSRSQLWMLLVMVAFTCLGLFLLSQANA
jgi:hypothetical protein